MGSGVVESGPSGVECDASAHEALGRLGESATFVALAYDPQDRKGLLTLLGSGDTGFDGGDFAFVDEACDEIIAPRAGRLLLFASVFEHLHRVKHVTSGTRLVLASWFTLNPSAGHALDRFECVL